MAQTKSIKAKTSARSTKKQPKTGLAKSFDLNNKRVRFFSVIALIAVLGGGFFLVRSFAAIENYGSSQPATVANGRLKPWGGAVIVTDKAKNNLRVVKAAYGQSAGTSGQGGIVVSRGYKVHFCATVRSDRSGTFAGSVGFQGKGGGWDIKASTQWSESCSPQQGPYSTDTSMDISVFNTNQGNNIYVSQVYVKNAASSSK